MTHRVRGLRRLQENNCRLQDACVKLTHQEANADHSDDRIDGETVLLEERHKGETKHLREKGSQQESTHVRYLAAERD